MIFQSLWSKHFCLQILIQDHSFISNKRENYNKNTFIQQSAWSDQAKDNTKQKINNILLLICLFVQNWLLSIIFSENLWNLLYGQSSINTCASLTFTFQIERSCVVLNYGDLFWSPFILFWPPNTPKFEACGHNICTRDEIEVQEEEGRSGETIGISFYKTGLFVAPFTHLWLSHYITLHDGEVFFVPFLICFAWQALVVTTTADAVYFSDPATFQAFFQGQFK